MTIFVCLHWSASYHQVNRKSLTAAQVYILSSTCLYSAEYVGLCQGMQCNESYRVGHLIDAAVHNGLGLPEMELSPDQSYLIGKVNRESPPASLS